VHFDATTKDRFTWRDQALKCKTKKPTKRFSSSDITGDKFISVSSFSAQLKNCRVTAAPDKIYKIYIYSSLTVTVSAFSASSGQC